MLDNKELRRDKLTENSSASFHTLEYLICCESCKPSRPNPDLQNFTNVEYLSTEWDSSYKVSGHAEVSSSKGFSANVEPAISKKNKKYSSYGHL